MKQRLLALKNASTAIKTKSPLLVAALAVASAFLLVAPSSASAAAAAAAGSGKKPNILFIMGDDIGWMQPSIYHQGLMV